MGEYVMNSPMISIPMGGADVVLGIQWLQSLGTMAFNFQELFMKFSLEGKEIELRGIIGKLIQVDIGGHPPSPTGPKHVFGNFSNLLFLAVFNFRGHFEALNDVF
jgi:hypothetical protein